MSEESGKKRAWIVGALTSGCLLGAAIGAVVGYFLGKRGSRMEQQVAHEVQELPDRLRNLSQQISARVADYADPQRAGG